MAKRKKGTRRSRTKARRRFASRVLVGRKSGGIKGAKRPAGPQGAKGPRGRRGPRGSRGVRGLVGLRGKIGRPGGRGPQGVRGRTGRDPAIAVMEEQLHDVYRQLDIQLKRMAQLQQQVDELTARQNRINGIVR